MSNTIQNISIIGDGGWGTTLALYLAKKGLSVKLWGPFPEYIKFLNKKRINKKFLDGIKIPTEISILDRLDVCLEEAQLVILAIPSKYATDVLKKLKKFDFSDKIILSVIKGIETSTLRTMSQNIQKELGKVQLAVLSGPTIAIEVAQGIPSTAVIASRDIRLAKRLQTVFNSSSFRIYTNSDLIGVEIGGCIKNIIAIACGVCDGLGFGTNTKAAILTRGLAEMTRLGRAFGAKKKTFYGLSGLGDVVTTCTSPRSRNRSVGEQLGKGKTIFQITQSMDMVAEGVTTVKAIFQLSQKYNISMPITHEVFNVIYKRKNPLIAVQNLMTRKTKSE